LASASWLRAVRYRQAAFSSSIDIRLMPPLIYPLATIIWPMGRRTGRRRAAY
jgi:hypothetical protein